MVASIKSYLILQGRNQTIISLRGSKVDSRGAKGAERGGERRLGRGTRPIARFFLLFDLKMDHFSAVFKLDLTEETRTQLQKGRQ